MKSSGGIRKVLGAEPGAQEARGPLIERNHALCQHVHLITVKFPVLKEKRERHSDFERV